MRFLVFQGVWALNVNAVCKVSKSVEIVQLSCARGPVAFGSLGPLLCSEHPLVPSSKARSP